MGGFSVNGARHYFGQADFSMPELLLKELRSRFSIYNWHLSGSGSIPKKCFACLNKYYLPREVVE